MRLKKFLLVFSGTVLVTGIIAVLLTPLLVAGVLRLWATGTAPKEGLAITFEKIEAPLFRPVVVHNLKIASLPGAPFQATVAVPRVEIELHLAGFFDRSHGRFLRSFIADGLRVDIRRMAQSAPPPQRFTWRILEDLLADNFKLSSVELHVENGETIVDLHNGTLSGAQIEAGVFGTSEVTIQSPWLHKSFSQLRGVTSWQDSQFTIGALSLTRGLDLDALTIDLSHVGESRLGLEVGLDAFGGKLRARISNDDREDKRIWDAAGTASEISLAQMSDALDLTDRASGSLHACKFTFRGEANNLQEATASLWAEVTELTWRDRTADTIMIGASLYNHQVQVEQLFVKQRNNQFILNGESALPQKWSDWLNPDFHGDIAASINDLGDFARLFGASPADFAGKIDISGNVNSRERKLGGQFSAAGNSLTLFRAPVESLRVELSLKESHLEITEFELRRESDSFHGEGNLNLAGDHSYAFKFTSSIADFADYAALVPQISYVPQFGGQLELDWTGHGTETTYSGTLRAQGNGLYLLNFPILPFDAEIEGDYSPDGVFFRQFHFANQHAAFGAFVTVATDYLQLQALRLDLNGKPKLQGNMFLPVSASKLKKRGAWLDALSDNPVFDLDLTLDPVDLAELAGAITKQPKMSGQASGSVEIHGPPASLEGKSIIHLRDSVFDHEAPFSIDAEARSSGGILTAKAVAILRGSDPINLEGSMPLRLEKRDSGYLLNRNGPLTATISFPAVLLSRLPTYLSRWTFVDGILSGRLTISDSWPHPQLRGSAHLINGALLGGASLSTGISFNGQVASIDFAQIAQKNVRSLHARTSTATTYTARGEIDFHDLADIQMKIVPTLPVTALTPLEENDCISGIELSPNTMPGLLRRQQIDEIDVRGASFEPNWTISFTENQSNDPLEALLQGGSLRTFPICSDHGVPGKRLLLGLAWLPSP